MRQTRLGVSAVVLALVFISSLCQAAPFDEQFKASKVTGACTIKVPGAADYAPIEEGKSYPYGSAIKTAAGAEVMLALSDGNTCRIIQNTDLVLEQDATDKKLKRAVLDQGTVVIQLEADYAKNNAFELKVPSAVCIPTGGRFVAGTGSEAGIVTTGFQVDSGELKINSNYFSIQSVRAGDKLSLSYPNDKVWYRVKNMAGKFTVVWMDSEGTSKSAELMDKKSLKIFIIKSATTAKELRAVYLFGADNRTTLASWVESGAAVEGLDTVVQNQKGAASEALSGAAGAALLWTEIPTPTTTTTTVPSPTPVGDR